MKLIEGTKQNDQTGGSFHTMHQVEQGLTKDQAADLIDLLNKVREKYNSNNLALLTVDKQINMVLAKKGIKYQSKAGAKL